MNPTTSNTTRAGMQTQGQGSRDRADAPLRLTSLGERVAALLTADPSDSPETDPD